MPGDHHNTKGRAPPDGAASRTHHAFDDRLDFWQAAHRALRGRGVLALLIAGGGAIAGAWAGSMLGQRLYSSTGLVRIASVLPQVMRETDQNRPMANFDGFIEAQRELMTSREMIHAAMQDDTWLRAATGVHTLSEEQFASCLKVDTRQRSDHLKVTFRNKDRTVTAPAVRSIIAAYQRHFVDEQKRADDQRTGQIKARRDALAAELKKLDDSLGNGGQPRSSAEIEPLYLAAAERVKKLRTTLADVEFAIAGGPELSLPRPQAQSPGEIADDELLRSYAAELAKVEILITHGKSRGFGPAHPNMIWLNGLANECRDQVAKYTRLCEAREAAANAGAAPMTLKDRQANLQRLVKAADAEMAQLIARRAQLKSYDDQAAIVRQSIAETDSRLDALATEASLGGRLTVINSGDLPMTAMLDNRGKYSALGAVAGMALPVGFMIAGTLRRRKYRFCDELAADMVDRVPLIAVLPDVKAAAGLGAAAGQSIHDLRVRLQPKDASDRRAYLITSVSSGEGKSSVAVSLGLSFAAAGYKTLVIDADLTSRRLTHGFDANESKGVIEATAGEDPLIRWTHSGLCFLAAGCPGPQDTGMLAPAGIGQLLTKLRERFDVVLVDSDAILSGLTASVIAPLVSGVVLTLARGQEQTLTRNAVRHLHMLHATPAAAVFNRADVSDFRAILADHSMSPPRTRTIPERLRRFGPLVNSVLSSLSLTRERDLDLKPVGASLAHTDGDRSDQRSDEHRTEHERRSAA